MTAFFDNLTIRNLYCSLKLDKVNENSPVYKVFDLENNYIGEIFVEYLCTSTTNKYGNTLEIPYNVTVGVNLERSFSFEDVKEFQRAILEMQKTLNLLTIIAET